MRHPSAVFLSFRLGDTDGVSVEAGKWEWALRNLGFSTRRVAGEFGDAGRSDDVRLSFLAISATEVVGAGEETLREALTGADLVVVENLCSLPLNVTAARAAVEVLRDATGRIAFHHHDLPWERPELAPVTGIPPRLPSALHVTISDQARCSLGRRGIDAVTIRNTFDVHPPAGARGATRDGLGFQAGDLVVLQPTRAIARKAVGSGLGFAEQLAELVAPTPVQFWLTGPAEDGYGPTLDRLVAAAAVPVTLGRTERVIDAYAAADVVVVPSTWEGFGNPVVEAMVARRPVAAAPYPTLTELTAFGLRVLPIDDVAAVARWLRRPDVAWLDQNRAVVERELGLDRLPGRLAAAFASVGWNQW